MGKEVQKLYPWKVRGRKVYDVVWPCKMLRLCSIGRMRFLGACRGVLVVRSAGQKCGAVVPHCDFQKYLPWIALKQRVLPFARTRIGRAPPRPRLCASRRYPGRASECNTPRDSGKRTDPKRLTPHFPKFSKFYKQKPLMKVCLRILNY